MHPNLRNIRKLIKSIKVHLHRSPAIKFLVVIIILTIYLGISVRNFGAKEGFLISLLTWTFFVLCTPIADAGFILDLPIRLITGVKMIYSEIIVWSIAITANIIIFFSNSQLYENTQLLSLFYNILSQPIPFWTIILLSAGGTFLSLLFGDELLDISYEQKKERTHHQKHKHTFRIITIITLFVLILAIYDFLLNKLGVSIPWF